MSSITCPICSSEIRWRQFFNSSTKPFCARCGWNLNNAESSVRDKRNTLIAFLVGLVGIGIIVGFSYSRNGDTSLFIIPLVVGLIVFVPLINYLSARRAIVAAKTSAIPRDAPVDRSPDSFFQLLQVTPQPRRVRVDWRKRIFLVAFLTTVILVIFLLAVLSSWNDSPNQLSNSPYIPLLFLGFVFSVSVIPLILREKRNWVLLRDGEIAQARVLAQRTVHRGRTSYSQIEVEFRATSGEFIHSSQTDFTGKIFEDMWIIVFYSPFQPSRNVALCATYLTVEPRFY